MPPQPAVLWLVKYRAVDGEERFLNTQAVTLEEATSIITPQIVHLGGELIEVTPMNHPSDWAPAAAAASAANASSA